MINEERVKHMTAMAIFEKEMGPEYQPMLKYSKKEYIALHGWGGFLAGTILYVALYVAIIIYLISNEVIPKLTTMYMLLIALVGLLAYAAYIIIHVHNVRRRASRQYKRGRRLIKELAAKYSKLNYMYEDEAQQTKPLLARGYKDLD